MASSPHDNSQGPRPLPPLQRPTGGRDVGISRGFDKEDKALTKGHAEEMRAIARGHNTLERSSAKPNNDNNEFFAKPTELLKVRSWVQNRPVDSASPPQAALVAFPRLWTTNRGRYCRFQAPGAGSYGILRARPSF